VTEGLPSGGECLDRRKEIASHRAGPSGLVAAAHSTSHPDSARNCRDVLKAAGVPVRAPGGWGHSQAKPAIEVSTDSAGGLGPVESDTRPGRSSSASACEPDREFIEAALAKGRNAMAVWQDLVDGHGFSEKYSSVKRFVRKLRGSPTPEAR
jgi:hypothetical protein